MSTPAREQTAEPLQQLLVEQFVSLCTDPDDQATARGVDQTLRELEAVLAAGSQNPAG